MAEFGNGLAEESLLDSDPGHSELEDPGVEEEPGLDEGEAAIEDPVSEGRSILKHSVSVWCRAPIVNQTKHFTFAPNHNLKEICTF